MADEHQTFPEAASHNADVVVTDGETHSLGTNATTEEQNIQVGANQEDHQPVERLQDVMLRDPTVIVQISHFSQRHRAQFPLTEPSADDLASFAKLKKIIDAGGELTSKQREELEQIYQRARAILIASHDSMRRLYDGVTGTLETAQAVNAVTELLEVGDTLDAAPIH